MGILSKWILKNKRTQQDEKGNLYQLDGGIVPKKCQKCNKELISVITEVPIVQKVPFYKCKKCNYANVSGDNALWHEHENKGHSVQILTKARTIEFKRIIPETPYIKETSKDVIILCHKCHVKKT